jgi:hypothetical protein
VRVGYLQFDPLSGKEDNLARLRRSPRISARRRPPRVPARDDRLSLRLARVLSCGAFPGRPSASSASRRPTRPWCSVPREKRRAVYNLRADARTDFTLYRKAPSSRRKGLVRSRTRVQPTTAAGTSVGLMICFDWYYPRSRRSTALEARAFSPTRRTSSFHTAPTRCGRGASRTACSR